MSELNEQSQLQELLKYSELESMKTRSLEAHRRKKTSEPTGSVKVTVTFGLDTVIAKDSKSFTIELATKIAFPHGQAQCSVVAKYRVIEGFSESIKDPLLLDFANEVAVMMLLPFVRQNIADLTQRVFEKPFILPIYARGRIRFESKDLPE